MTLSYRHLRAFAAVARDGSVTRAAAELNVSQPALTQTINALERIAGTRLLDRGPRGITLTAAGQEFLTVAEQLIEITDRALADLRNLSEVRRGLVSVAGLPSVASGFLPKIVARFRTRHPNVRVIIHDGLADDIGEAVRRGHCEMGLTCLLAPDPDFDTQTVTDDDMMLLCPRDHPLASAPRVGLAAIARHPFIGLSRQSSTRAVVDRAFASAGLYMSPDYEVQHSSTAGGMVAEGLGVTMLPRLCHSLVSAGNVVWRTIAEPPVRRNLTLVRLAGRSLSPAADAFWRHIVEHGGLLDAARASLASAEPVVEDAGPLAPRLEGPSGR